MSPRLVFLGSVAGAVAVLVACSSDSSSPATSSTPDAGKTDSGNTVADSGNSDTSDADADADAGYQLGTIDNDPCAPTSSCNAVDKSCLGLVDNSAGTTFAVRMTQATIAKPASIGTGTVAGVIENTVLPTFPQCNLDGTGTFSLLMQFDTSASALLIGGARPVADPTQGYAFDTETLTGLAVAPQTVTAAVTRGQTFATTTGFDLTMPIFLQKTGDDAIVLPLHETSLNGTLSANGNCIGSYNSTTLDPSNSCQPSGGQLAFTNGGRITAFMTIAETDSVTITSLRASLCVVLAGPASSDAAQPTAHCLDTVKGDWCSTTNAAATSDCADAFAFDMSYAASSIKVTNGFPIDAGSDAGDAGDDAGDAGDAATQ